MANSIDVLHHIEAYEKKLGVSFFDEWDINKFPFVLLFPDGSLATYGMEPDTIVVGPTSGPLKKVLGTLEQIARVVHLGKIKTCTTRNPKAYAKLSGATCVKEAHFDDKPNEYTFVKQVKEV